MTDPKRVAAEPPPADPSAPERILQGLVRHPRVALQRWAATEAARDRIAETLPALVSFSGAPYAGVLAVLDWDHRLPTASAKLRLFAYGDAASLARGREALVARGREIARRDIYPEFDVPDFAGIPADESYEAQVDRAGTVTEPRLVSPWRRVVPPEPARVAVRLVRRSAAYREVRDRNPRRPARLGDLEAMSWTPPCESGHGAWTVDVWYLTAMGPNEGRGQSFLVDPVARAVVATREFSVRPR